VKNRRAGDDDPRARGRDARIIVAAVLPTRSSWARTSFTLDSLRGMKVWPPKPGSTDMTSTKSTSPAICSSTVTGVDGLRTTPALAPSALIA
jgi:hypothetical protein